MAPSACDAELEAARGDGAQLRACQGWGPAHGYSEGGASGEPVVELPQRVADEREPLTHMQVMEHLPAELRGPGRHFEVPQHQPAFGGAASDTRHLPPLDWDAGAQMPYPLSGDDGNVRQRLVESHQHESQAGEDGKATFAQNLGREVSSPGHGRRRTKRRAEAQAPGIRTSDGAAANGYGAYQSAQHLLCQLSLPIHDMDGANLRSQAGLQLWGTLLGLPADSSPQAGLCA